MQEISDFKSKTVEHRSRRSSRSGAGEFSRSLAVILLALLLLLPVLTACSKDGETQEPATASSEATTPVSELVETQPPSLTPIDPTASMDPTPTPTVGPPPAPLAALVNGQYVFLEEYERQVSIYEQALQDQGFDLDSDEGQAEAVQIRTNILEGLIDSLLMREEAEKLGLALSDEELDAQMAVDIEDGGGEAAFEEWLESTGQTRADYREMLHDLMLSDRVLEVIATELPVVAEQVHIRHIAVSSPDSAQEIVKELQEGADFAELARERSEDTLTRDDGGDLGWFPAGIVAPELERAAFSLQAGEVSGVIQLGEGYHVIQLVERQTDRPVSPDLEMDLELAAFEDWLEELRAAAVIERFVEQ
jgi:parvulin-like peptidyl-prolyl isomerase